MLKKLDGLETSFKKDKDAVPDKKHECLAHDWWKTTRILLVMTPMMDPVNQGIKAMTFKRK
jgi:hypothetical protein